MLMYAGPLVIRRPTACTSLIHHPSLAVDSSGEYCSFAAALALWLLSL